MEALPVAGATILVVAAPNITMLSFLLFAVTLIGVFASRTRLS